MKKTRTVILFLLIASLMMPIPVYAIHIDDENTATYNSAIYWIEDEELFYNLFADPSDSVVQEITYAEKTNRINPNINESSACYSFDIDGFGPIEPVRVYGMLREKRYGDAFVLQEGIMHGSTNINGAMYKVNAVVQKEINGTRVYSGITMMPENAESLDDFIFFAIGDPIISADLLPSWFGNDDNSTDEISSRLQDYKVDVQSSTGYTLKDSDETTFSSDSDSEGFAQRLEFYHNSTINRSCVGVTSNTTAVSESFEFVGIADTIVSNLEIGLQGKSSNVPYIVNVHEIPEDSEDGSDFIDPEYIGYLTGLLSDVFDIPGSLLTPFEVLLNALSENNRVDISVFTSGTDTSVTFDYNTTLFQTEDVKFDDAPMLVTFNLASASSAYGYFSAYSNIEYYTVIAPFDPSAMPIFLSIDGGNAETSYCYFMVK